MNTRILKKLDNLEKGYKELCNANSANKFIHLKNVEAFNEIKKTLKEDWEANKIMLKEQLKINKIIFTAIKQLEKKIDKK